VGAFAGAPALLVLVALSWLYVPGRVRTFKEARDVRARIVDRLGTDVTFIRAELETAPIPVNERAVLRARLDQAAHGIASIGVPDLAGFTTVLPLNPAHAAILAVHGAMLAARGMTTLVVWKTHRYDAVPLMAVPPPPADDVPSIDVVLMSHEYRADAVLLTNATGEQDEVRLYVSDVPGAPQPDWLGVSGVEWTDTQQAVPVADALPDARFIDGAFRIAVPAGMTRKVWLTVDGCKLAPGTYHGTLTAQTPRTTTRIPFTVHVSSVTMARPRLSVGVWDYTNGRGAYAITPQNRDAAIALMRSHFVDSPWATNAVLPWPKASDYDANGALTHPLDFRELDAWVRLWPDARHYYVAAGVGASFAGAEMDTPTFATRVAAWGRAVAQHAIAQGLAPRQLGLMLVDEPQDNVQRNVIAAWARVLKRAAPEIGLFENPVWPRPDLVSPADALTLADDLCFHLGVYSRAGEPVAKYFEGRRAAGQRLWMYQTTGPARLLDPTTYYRLAGWYAFRAHAVGSAFWAFGDTGGAETSWNDYASANMSDAPAFIGRRDVTDSVHWQAVLEGVEDYEYLAMVEDAAARTADVARKTEALGLVREAVAKVAKPYTGWFEWGHDPIDARPDEYRLRLISSLESLQPQ
jgi:hypothetical protein